MGNRMFSHIDKESPPLIGRACSSVSFASMKFFNFRFGRSPKSKKSEKSEKSYVEQVFERYFDNTRKEFMEEVYDKFLKNIGTSENSLEVLKTSLTYVDQKIKKKMVEGLLSPEDRHYMNFMKEFKLLIENGIKFGVNPEIEDKFLFNNKENIVKPNITRARKTNKFSDLDHEENIVVKPNITRARKTNKFSDLDHEELS